MKKQQGFTLIEMAIVLVIIGLLIGGVLKGQELIENSKTKSVVNDMKAVVASYNGYVDRYRAIPGDELPATMNARGWPVSASGGNGNSVLVIAPAATFTNAGEQPGFWRGLRASGLLSGDSLAVGVAALPLHGAAGLIGVSAGTVYGQVGTFVCASGLTTKQASAIDVMIDGALPAATQIGNNVGDLRGATGAANPLAPVAAAPAPLAYNETATLTRWTVCLRF